MAATTSIDPDQPSTNGTGNVPGELPKTLTGISGLDDVTGGGLPRGRSTLVCGPAGCGKTLLAMEFIVRGISQFDEPGVFVAFEETVEDLTANVASLGFDLAQLEADGKLVVDHIAVVRGEMQETGDWDLDGLFMRIGAAIDAIGAKRVVIDTIETLFGAFANTAILRSELRRLFGWLKDRGITSVITGERGDGTLTRHGIEEYVSDCVIVLDHRVTEQTSTRRLRILKYRGSLHGTNEYPFLIGESGVSVLPITSLGVRHNVPAKRMSTGWRVSTRCSVMEASTRGAPSSSAALPARGSRRSRHSSAMRPAAADDELSTSRSRSPSPRSCATCRRSASICRRWVDAELLQFQCFRPSLLGLEAHLFALQKAVGEFDPAVVVIDPISDLVALGTGADVSAMLTRQVDFLKAKGVTALFTSLNHVGTLSRAEQQMTSLADTWLQVKAMEGNGEHNRVLYVLKSRGMAHSNQIREFLLTNQGIELADVYVGPQGVLTGSARQAQEAKERSDGTEREEDLEQRRTNLERRRESVEAQTATLWREFEDEADIVRRLLSHGSTNVEDRAGQRAAQGRLRGADTDKRRHDDAADITDIIDIPAGTS